MTATRPEPGPTTGPSGGSGQSPGTLPWDSPDHDVRGGLVAALRRDVLADPALLRLVRFATACQCHDGDKDQVLAALPGSLRQAAGLDDGST